MEKNKSIFPSSAPTQAEVFAHLWETERTLLSLADQTAQLRRRIEESYQREHPENETQLYIDAGLLRPKRK